MKHYVCYFWPCKHKILWTILSIGHFTSLVVYFNTVKTAWLSKCWYRCLLQPDLPVSDLRCFLLLLVTVRLFLLPVTAVLPVPMALIFLLPIALVTDHRFCLLPKYEYVTRSKCLYQCLLQPDLPSCYSPIVYVTLNRFRLSIEGFLEREKLQLPQSRRDSH